MKKYIFIFVALLFSGFFIKTETNWLDKSSAPSGGKKIMYLHIGLPKTGTCAIQVFFAQNRDALLELGLNYPNSYEHDAENGKISGGNAMWVSQYMNMFYTSKLTNLINYFTYYYINSDLKQNYDILYSTELFTGSLSAFVDEMDLHDKLKPLRKIADKHGYEIKIICFYRSVVEYIYSYYAQCVKYERYSNSFAYFIRHDFDFNKILNGIKNWNNIIGTGNYYLVNYDDHKHNLPQPIAQIIGIDIGNIEKKTNTKKIINRSLSPKEILIAREFNKHFEGGGQFKYVSDILMSNLPKPNEIKSIIKQSDVEYIKQKYYNQVVDFNKKYGTNMKIIQKSTAISDENVSNELPHETKALIAIMADLVKKINK